MVDAELEKSEYEDLSLQNRKLLKSFFKYSTIKKSQMDQLIELARLTGSVLSVEPSKNASKNSQWGTNII